MSVRNVLNDMDKKIIHELQQDCRISLSDLSQKLDIAKSTLYYRIKRLEEEQIIEGYHAKINLERVKTYFLAFIQIQARHGKDNLDNLVKKLQDLPMTTQIYFLVGEYHLLVECRAEDQADFLEKYHEMAEWPEIFQSKSSVIAKILPIDHL